MALEHQFLAENFIALRIRRIAEFLKDFEMRFSDLDWALRLRAILQ